MSEEESAPSVPPVSPVTTVLQEMPSPEERRPLSMFQKVALIGMGDVGRVYLIRHKTSGNLYAMKVLTKSEMIRRNKVKRVLTEREILATADHPFIATLYSSFQTADYLFFILEYSAGGEFFRMLQKQPGKRLEEPAVRFYASEVLLALEYLHMMGFVYRDLKPENILLHETGHIRLTDFDLSKQAVNPSSAAVVKALDKHLHLDSTQGSTFNSFVGTEEYLAPEVVTGFGHTSSVDWWTFGILVFEMLTGTTPFKGRNQTDTFRRIVSQDLKFPSTPALSKHARDLIKKLLHRDPKRRLGARHGAPEIKKHPFFKGVNWALIRNETPPIAPSLTNELDISHFRKFDPREDILNDIDEIEEYDSKSEDLFSGFDYSGAKGRDAYGKDVAKEGEKDGF